MSYSPEKSPRAEPRLLDTLDAYLLVNADILTRGVSTKVAGRPVEEGAEAHELYLVPQSTSRESTLILAQPHSLDQTEVTFSDDTPTVTHYNVTQQNQVLTERELAGDERQAALECAESLLGGDSAAEILAAHRETLPKVLRQLSAFSLQHHEHLSVSEILERRSREQALRLTTSSVHSRAADTPRV